MSTPIVLGTSMETPSALTVRVQAVDKVSSAFTPTTCAEMAAADFSKLLEGDLYEGELNGKPF